ncbi:MAG TPA: DUF2199 domain-containing protein [Gaiellaceae bacterium]|nr:DUF2199 domain-containing protein [Gaiellaceae bacterium]
MRWTCSRCGAEHEGVPLDWAYDTPIYWDGGRNSADWLTEDLCTWTDDAGDRNYFIRGVLELPIVDSPDRLGYGVWSSLSEDSFSRVVDLWDDPARTDEPAYFGWLSNSLPAYPETLNLALDVVVQELDKRPLLYLHDGDHPLIEEQQRGISLARVQEIAELNMHDD